MDYMPFTARTAQMLHGLAALEPRTLATMHGSSFTGDCGQALRDLVAVLRETFETP